MTAEQQGPDAYLASLSNIELLWRAETCEKDLHEAAEKENNSEWHGSCFAAMILFCQELNRRGLKLHPQP